MKRKREQKKKLQETLEEDLRKNQLFDLSAALEKLSTYSSLLPVDNTQQPMEIQSQIKENDNNLKRKFRDLEDDDDILSMEKIINEFKKLKITDSYDSARKKRNSELCKKLESILADYKFLESCNDSIVLMKQLSNFFIELDSCRTQTLPKTEWLKKKLGYLLEACFSSPELDMLMLETHNYNKFTSKSSKSEAFSSFIFDTIDEFGDV